MPEGHVVHADARRFTAAMTGRVVRACSPQGRFAAGAAALDGRVLRVAEAYGKNLFLGFSGPWLHVHLGLIGSWTWWDASGTQTAGRPTRVVSDSGVRLRLTVGDGDSRVSAELRGMSVCSLADEATMDAVLASLGPDPLRPDASGAAAWERIRHSRTPIGSLLLDQSVVAGAGLIWRCEAPYLAGISPYRPGSSLAEAEWATLWHELSRIMRTAVHEGTPWFHVFRRGGEPCLRCGTTVEVATLTGRKVWWCPHDQPYELPHAAPVAD